MAKTVALHETGREEVGTLNKEQLRKPKQDGAHQLAYRRVCLRCRTIEPNPRGKCNVLAMNLSDIERAKLACLAHAQGKTAEQCVKVWIASCQINSYGEKPVRIRTPEEYRCDPTLWKKPETTPRE